MFTEWAVLRSWEPICSAMFMKRLLNTSSRTGSTSVPSALPVARASTRRSTRWPRALTWARHPGATTVVAFVSGTRAGPSIV